MVIHLNIALGMLHIKEMLVMYCLLLKEMDTVTWVQILGKAVCILHSADTFGNSILPTILTPALGK